VLKEYSDYIHAPASRKVRWSFLFLIDRIKAEMASILLIDGENFRGKMRSVFREAGRGKPAWHKYDFKGLLNKALGGIALERKIFYFARVKAHEASKKKSRQLIDEQRLLKTHLEGQGFEVILSGRVRGQMEEDDKGKKVLVFKEKGVDVRIAVDMMSAACDKSAKEIILGSSDSDLQLAVSETKARGVKCVYLGFEAQPNKGLSYTTGRTILIRDAEVFEFDKTKTK
jgi:uncharacterized LabA/DUF88 family protein